MKTNRLNKILLLILLLSIFLAWPLSTSMGKQTNSLQLSESKSELVAYPKDYVVLKKNTPLAKQLTLPNTTYVIRYSYGLKDPQGTKPISIPDNCTLLFEGGSINNGTLVGCNTKIKGGPNIFSNVNILGRWNVPVISTKMWKKQSNVLYQVEKMLNPDIHNTVYIYDCEANISSYLRGESSGYFIGMNITGNTDVFIDGTIKTSPNPSGFYYILLASGDNINISGGNIQGDKLLGPLSREGRENGHGIGVSGNNINISDVDISHCWGDAIYITGADNGGNNINISQCKLHDSRRQGISVAGGSNIRLQDNIIYSIRGTDPQFGIDIENNDTINANNILIDNNDIYDCIGGVTTSSASSTTGRLHNIIVTKNKVHNCSIGLGQYGHSDSVVYEYNTIENCEVGLNFRYTEGLIVHHNIIKSQQCFYLIQTKSLLLEDNTFESANASMGYFDSTKLHFKSNKFISTISDGMLQIGENYKQDGINMIFEDNQFSGIWFSFVTWLTTDMAKFTGNTIMSPGRFIQGANNIKIVFQNNKLTVQDTNRTSFVFNGISYGEIEDNEFIVNDYQYLLNGDGETFFERNQVRATSVTPSSIRLRVGSKRKSSYSLYNNHNPEGIKMNIKD